MKTLFTKSISVLLCLVMVFSCTATAFAANTIDAKADVKYFQTATEAENAKTVLDVADKALSEIEQPTGDTKKLLDTLKTFGITIAYGSVNDVLKTIDSISGLDTVLSTLGDLGDLNFGVWQKNMKRPADDAKAIYEVIELLGTTQKKKVLFGTAKKSNPEIISSLVKGDDAIDFGIAEGSIKVSDFLGKDGLYGMIKSAVVETVYEKGSAEYNVNYTKTLDYFLYENLIPALVANEGGPLPGFTMSNKSTVDSLLTAALYSLWAQTIAPAIKGLNYNWAKDESGNVKAELKDLIAAVNFDGSTFDPSTVKIDMSKSFAEQINDLFGVVAKFFVADCTWESGDYTKISKNLNGLLLHVAKKLGITTATASSEATALEITKYVLARIESDDVDSYVEGIENCKNMKDAAAIVLRNTADLNNIKVTDKADATYEEILGDIAVSLVCKFVDLGYEGGEGKDVWTVLNDVVNIFFFDQGLASALNLSVKKTDSVFAKLDAIIGMTGLFAGLTPAENYKAEPYLKGLLDAVFSLDLEKIVDLTVVRFIGDFGQKNAIKTVYEFLATTLKSFFGRDILAAYSESNPLNTAIKNENLAETLKNLLIALNERKSDLAPVVLNGANFLINPEIKATEITVADQPYTVDGAPASAKVKVGGKEFTLKNGVDYTATLAAAPVAGQSATATLDLSGFVKGTATVTYKLVLSPVKNLKASDITSTTATLTWDKADNADKYEVFANGKSVGTTESTSFALTGIKEGSKVTYSVKAVVGSAYSDEAKVTFETAPAKVTGLKAKKVTSTTVALSWKKAAGASEYIVSYSTNGKKWKTAKTKKTSITLKKLSSNKKYYFKVQAIKGALKGEESSKINATTRVAAVTGLKAKTKKKTSITLSWKKVTGATGYEVYRLQGKKWKKAGTVKKGKTTTYTVKKLKKNTSYKFKVRAVKSKNAGDYSKVVTVKTAKK